MIETCISVLLPVVEAEAFRRAVAPVSEGEALLSLVREVIEGRLQIKEEAE